MQKFHSFNFTNFYVYVSDFDNITQVLFYLLHICWFIQSELFFFHNISIFLKKNGCFVFKSNIYYVYIKMLG